MIPLSSWFGSLSPICCHDVREIVVHVQACIWNRCTIGYFFTEEFIFSPWLRWCTHEHMDVGDWYSFPESLVHKRLCQKMKRNLGLSYLADDESYIYVQQLKFIIWRMLGLHTRFPSYWDMHLLTLSRDFQSVCSTSAFLPSVSTHHKWSSVVLRFSTNLSEELWFLSCFQFVQTEESSWPRYGQLKKDLELDYFISVTHFGGLVELLQDGNASWKIWETGEHKQSTWTMQHPLVHPIAYKHGTAKQRQRLLYHS